MSALASVSTVDFTDYHCAFLNLDIAEYPEVVRSTVERMRRFTKSHAFISGELIGKGTTGNVYKATYRDEGGLVHCAAKVFKDADFRREETANLWKAAGVPHVVRLHGTGIVNKDQHALFLEYVDGPSMWVNLTSISLSGLYQADFFDIFTQLFEFLEAIHRPAPNRKKGLIYGDLYWDHLYWKDRQLTVIDFGFTSEIGESFVPVIQKTYARAPEVMLNQLLENNLSGAEQIRYDESADVWSAGVLIFEYITKKSFIGNPLCYSYAKTEIAAMIGRIEMPSASYLKTVVAANKFFDEKEDHTFVLKKEMFSQVFPPSLDEEFRSTPDCIQEVLPLLKRILRWDPEDRILSGQVLMCIKKITTKF